MLYRIIALALLCLATAACRPGPDAAAPPAKSAAAIPVDPVSAALSGSAQRSLESRHPGVHVILVNQTVNRGVDQAWVCGDYILLNSNNTRRTRYFIVSTTELVELRGKTDRRWVDTCADAKPMPGSLDDVGAETQVALLTRR